MQVCDDDGILDCPQHESGNGGEDEDGCEGEEQPLLVTKYCFDHIYVFFNEILLGLYF